MPLLIRSMEPKDIPDLNKWFGPDTDYARKPEKWDELMKEHTEGVRTLVVAEKDGETVGYCSLLYTSKYPPLRDAHIPEINDLVVAPPARKQGIARSIIEHLEQVAREKGHKAIGICVGLYSHYGQAQRLYVKMGYIPDGKGTFYDNHPCTPGQTYKLDDELVIGFTKEL